MAKGYWIAHITVTDPERYADYVRLDSPVIEAYGGRFLVRGGRSIAPEAPQRDRHVVVEFPDLDTALACYRSEDYQKAAAIRRETSDSDIVIVEGPE